MFGGIGVVYAKTFKSRLLIPILSLILFVSLPFSVSAAVGVGSMWDGQVVVSIPDSCLYLNYDRAYSYQTSDGTVTSMHNGMIFKGDTNVIIDIDSNSTGVYLNGTLKKRVVVSTVASGPSGNITYGYLTPSSLPVTMNNVFVTTSLVERQSGGSCSFDIFIEFDNYYVEQSIISLPLSVNFTLDAFLNSAVSLWSPEILYADITVIEDYTGDIMQYDNLEDVPSVDGYFAEQNTTIINQSQTQIQNQEIQNQLQTEQNQLQQESNEQNKNFMDNFFGNLGNTVLSWIVPSSEQITTFFDEVNAWFSDRLGFVWYPFDLAYQLVSAFAQGDANTNFKVPGFTLNFQGQQLTIWQPLEVDIDAFGIFQYVRFFTSTILVCGVIKMAIDKWDEWIGGHAV